LNRTDYPLGFHVTGNLYSPRVTVDAAAAFAAYAACATTANLKAECYLSAFRFGVDYHDHVKRHGSPKGFAGCTWSPWLWIDIDAEVIDVALVNACRLVAFVLERYPKFDEESLLIFFSGKKGFHLGLPLHNPHPSPAFNATCRQLAEGLAASVGVKIDTGVYDRVRAFRAPNSFHPTGQRHKRHLSHAELFGLTAERILEIAREPAPFDLPQFFEVIGELESDWNEAAALVAKRQASRTTATTDDARVTRSTLDFIREGAEVGSRRPRLFSAAANLREFGAPPLLIVGLLLEAALDTGLPPSEVERQIRCGIEHADRQQAGAA
jgi:hypothetical protein